jgi:guanine deaminase
MNKFMKAVIGEAIAGMREGEGGPFGAVIVKKGEIIAKGHNEVLKTNDPTAHAEIVAIRKAAKKLGRFDLSDCELYSIGDPCPMCYSAIRWAGIKKVYYGCTKKDAEKIGFADKAIHDELKGTSKTKVKFIQVDRDECLKAYSEWQKKKDKTPY